jgi:putative transcriptional regulator
MNDSEMSHKIEGGANMGLKIKLRRIKLGIKQKDLAADLGISQQYLNGLEAGRNKNPNRRLMMDIAKALETDVQTLFFSEE